MDLLASLGLENALPEQSTRLNHPGVISALEEKNNDNSSSSLGECHLGFNCCLTCGATLLQPSNNNSSINNNSGSGGGEGKLKKKGVIINCKGCNRVKYCSEVCRKVDAEPQQQQVVGGGGVDDIVDEGALGHSPVICSLLNLCNDDEAAEDDLYNTTKRTPTTNNNKQQQQKYEAAKYRVQTERESYPATLFNMFITDGPSWFIENLTRKLRHGEGVCSPDAKKGRSGGSGGGGGGDKSEKKRRGKRDRQSLNQEEETEGTMSSSTSGLNNNRRELVLHIIGASSDSELWGWDGTTTNYTHNELLDAYAEASTNVVSYLKNFVDTIDSIRLVFVGPDCPRPKQSKQHGGGGDDMVVVCRCETSIPGTKTMLRIETHCCNYGEDHNGQDTTTTSFPTPDAICFFNPGLSCPDYDWSKALSFAASSTTPFLLTTNTEMEGFADIKCLVDGGYLDSKELPTDILETIGVDDAPSSNNNSSKYNNDDDDEEQNKKFFFCENPYAGLRVRQSGTMGNDLYVKSRWVMGGLFQQRDGGGDVVEKKKKKVEMVQVKESQKKKKRKESEEGGSSSRKKKRCKVGNPALI